MMCQARITEHPQTAVEPIAARLGVGVEDCLASTSMLVGTAEEVCELVERRRAELGVSYIALQSDAYREIPPVVARLAGSCSEQPHRAAPMTSLRGLLAAKRAPAANWAWTKSRRRRPRDARSPLATSTAIRSSKRTRGSERAPPMESA